MTARVRITMADIADALGVSQTTVSLTLNGKANRQGIALETQKRILDYVEECGYVPDLDAAGLAGGGGRRVGVVLSDRPQEISENHRALFFGLLSAIHEAGAQALIQAVERDTIWSGFRFLAGKGVSDITVIGDTAKHFCEQSSAMGAMLKRLRVLLVDHVFRRGEPAPPAIGKVVRIGIDRVQAFSAALELLHSRGHRVLGVYPSILEHIGREDLRPDLQRELTWAPLQAPADNGSWHEKGKMLAPEVLSHMRGEGCSAVMLHSDAVAMGLITALADMGIGVPDELSVMGFSNTASSGFARVPLTTVEVPVDGMLTVVRERLFGQRTGQPEGDVVLPTRLIERASVGDAPRRSTQGF